MSKQTKYSSNQLAKYIADSPGVIKKYIQSGFLAPGSIYSLRLPTKQNAVASTGFVPGYSGGSATDSNRLPYD